MFDKPFSEIHDLYHQRYTLGKGDKQIHYPVFPGYGNHDINPISQDSIENLRGRESNLHLLDSILLQKFQQGKF